ncbi:Glucoamylase [Candidatus Burkholderia humilis]|nr:Glucoamylase [Candidatus Burkholderia humilis]
MGHACQHLPPPALPVDARGMIGNMKTSALVSLRGAIDFMCYPRIDSPTLFAALLDGERGGSFGITPRASNANVKQMYLPETNVLLTRFMTGDGVCELLDLMPVPSSDARVDEVPNCVMRIVRLIFGHMTLDVQCDPRFDYARVEHQTPPVQLLSNAPLSIDANVARATLELKEGDSVCFAFGASDALHKLKNNFDDFLHETIDYWKAWSSHSTYRGRYREVMLRSALTLKLLSSDEFGAIVAAPTFGLSEAQDGSHR